MLLKSFERDRSALQRRLQHCWDHLTNVSDNVMTTRMQAGNAALRQLLHMPRHPAVPDSSASQLRPPPSQQQVGQTVHASQDGIHHPCRTSSPAFPLDS